MTLTEETGAVPGQDAADLITDETALRTYLDSHAERHAPQDGGTCACGWPPVPEALRKAMVQSTMFHTQADHAAAVLIGDLGNLLPSDSSEKDSAGEETVLSWRALALSLYAEIDRRDRTIDPRFVTLIRWCTYEGHADIDAIAQLTSMHPGFLARLLDEPAPPAAVVGDAPADEEKTA